VTKKSIGKKGDEDAEIECY